MNKTTDILLDLSRLTPGVQTLSFHLDNAFFQGLDQDDILGGNAQAEVQVTARADSANLEIKISGSVQVTCDRCLDPMDLELEPIVENQLLKLADEDGEDDNAIYVSEDHPQFNLGWLLYEIIDVNLPVVHSHPEGQCNPEMQAILRELKVEEAEQ